MITVAPLVALAGCAHSAKTSSSGTSSSGSVASATGSPAISIGPSSPSNPAPLPQAHGSAGAIDVTVAAEDPTVLRPGGEPMRFSVKLANTATTPTVQVGMVVSLGHCSCGQPGAQMMLPGTMQMLDPDTKAWVAVPYVRE
jgi:hypothetical protein